MRPTLALLRMIKRAPTMGVTVPKRRAKRGTGEASKRKRLILSDHGRAPMQFMLPYPHSTNNLYFTDPRNGRRVLTTEGRNYKETVALENKARPFYGPVAVRIVLCKSRGRHIDTDNIKIVLDSLKGIAFIDDYQVEEHHVYRRREGDGCTVIVSTMTPADIDAAGSVEKV